MNSNFGFNNGMTIQIPAFNIANDQLFLAIQTYFDNRFNELQDQIQQIQSKSEKIILSTKKIESEIRNLKINNYKDISRRKTKLKYRKSLLKTTKTNNLMETGINEINPKRESIDQNIESSEIFETNSFLLGINKIESVENKYTSELSTKNCELPLDNIIKKYLKANESKIVYKDILEPIVIANPEEEKEIFIGGNENVKLPLWAYRKCLTCIRGKPNELSSRLCLRLLQAKFGRKYMLSHNYNGSGDKVPIDRQIMSAILVQARMQFPDQEDFQNNPAKFAMFRDYINNAFRVVAYRHRKGIQSNTPFWDQNGEPIADLDPPSWVADNNN